MNHGPILWLLVGLVHAGCKHVDPPPAVVVVESPVPAPTPIVQDAVPPSLPPPAVIAPPASPTPALPAARDLEATVFRANAPTRAEAVKQVTRAVRRHLQSELDSLVRRETAWCRVHLAFAREQLFFSQLSLAPAELGGTVPIEERLTVDSALPDGYQVVVSLPKGLPAQLLREHLRGLEPYVAVAHREAFRERYSAP